VLVLVPVHAQRLTLAAWPREQHFQRQESWDLKTLEEREQELQVKNR